MSADDAGTGPGVGAVVVDARGLRCPLPVIRLAAAARDLPAGTLVTVLSTDPAARHDVPAWARMRGHSTVGETDTDTETDTETDADTAVAGSTGDEGAGTTPTTPTTPTTWSLTVRLGATS